MGAHTTCGCATQPELVAADAAPQSRAGRNITAFGRRLANAEQISITEHFNAWKAAGMTLGSMLEAKVIIEVGGGSGSINFTTADVTAQ